MAEIENIDLSAVLGEFFNGSSNDPEYDGMPCKACGKEIPLVPTLRRYKRADIPSFDRSNRVDTIRCIDVLETFHKECWRGQVLNQV